MELFSSLLNFIGQNQRAKQMQKEPALLEKQKWKGIESANWQPEYASQHAPTFQRETSPVARAYLESFLTGTNPDAIQGTRYGADAQKQAAQDSFDAQTGGWDKLYNQQRAIEADTNRYKPTQITRQPNETMLGAGGQGTRSSASLQSQYPGMSDDLVNGISSSGKTYSDSQLADLAGARQVLGQSRMNGKSPDQILSMLDSWGK